MSNSLKSFLLLLQILYLAVISIPLVVVSLLISRHSLINLSKLCGVWKSSFVGTFTISATGFLYYLVKIAPLSVVAIIFLQFQYNLHQL